MRFGSLIVGRIWTKLSGSFRAGPQEEANVPSRKIKKASTGFAFLLPLRENLPIFSNKDDKQNTTFIISFGIRGFFAVFK